MEMVNLEKLGRQQVLIFYFLPNLLNSWNKLERNLKIKSWKRSLYFRDDKILFEQSVLTL